MKRINYIDLGTYEGRELDEFLKLGLKANCYCFEPHPEKYKFLKNKYKDCEKVFIIPSAVSKCSGKGKLYLNDGQGSSIFSTKNNVSKKGIEIVCIQLSLWLKHVIGEDDFNILRFNIEGAELYLIEDLIESGMYTWVNLYMGAEAGIDILKVGEIKDKYKYYIELLHEYSINIYPFCGAYNNDLSIITENYKRYNNG